MELHDSRRVRDTGVTGRSAFCRYNNAVSGCGTISNPNDGFGRDRHICMFTGRQCEHEGCSANGRRFCSALLTVNIALRGSPAHVSGRKSTSLATAPRHPVLR